MTVATHGPGGSGDPADDAVPAGAEGPDLIRPAITPKRHKRFFGPLWLQRLLGPFLVVVSWLLAARLDLVRDSTLPEPWSVIMAAADLIQTGELVEHLSASLTRVGLGLVVGLLAGVALALVGGLTRLGENLIDTNMEVLRAVPNLAFLPLLIVWLGIGEVLKVVFIALTVAIAIYINTYSSIRHVDPGLMEAARTFGLRGWGLVRHVVLPGSLPGFLVGLRLALTAMWIALIFAETVNAPSGLGRLMSDARQYFQLDVMFVVIIVYAVLGILSLALIRFLEYKLLNWHRSFGD